MKENHLGNFVALEVERAEMVYRGFRSRAASIFPVAGGLVTVLVGLFALAAGDRAEFLPASGKFLLALSLILLALSTFLGLVIQVPDTVAAADPCALECYVTNNWNEKGWNRRVAEFHITYLNDLWKANGRAAWIFRFALVCQLLAVVSLAILAWQIFAHLT